MAILRLFDLYTLEGRWPTATGKPKNILFISFEACAGDLAYRLKQEGYTVKWYVQSKADRVLYDGFLEKVDEWEPHKEWADLIIIDDIGFGALADRCAKKGKRWSADRAIPTVWSSTAISARRK